MALSQRKAGKAWRRFANAGVGRLMPTAGGYTRVLPTAAADRPGATTSTHRPLTTPVGKKPALFYAGYADLERDVHTLADKLPAGCDGVVGLPNSGLLPAELLAKATGIPLYTVDTVPTSVAQLVVVEDATQFVRFKQTYAHLAKGRKVLWTSVYACEQALQTLDAYAVEAPKPRVFAWNFHKYKNTTSFLFDIDGIICADPAGDQYNEPAYSEFVRTARPILPPLSSGGVLTGAKPALGTLVTGRKEAYRSATEVWLGQHVASWRGLHMRPDDAERGSVAIAQFKARVYAKSSAPLFVESSEKQARMIYEITGKPVVCPRRGFGTRGATDRMRPVKASGNTKIIYTISTGVYAKVAPEAFDVPEGWDYARLTDADCPAYLNSKQKAAWAKINGPRIFKQYECSLCIDDDMAVLKDPTALFGDAEFAVIKRERFNRVSDDFKAIVHARKAATQADVEKEAQRYADAGLADAPMWLSGVLYRKHTDIVKRVCDEWLFWYTQSETRRDQPSMNTALHAHGVTPMSLYEKGNLLGYISHDMRKADRAGVRFRLK